ncbi:carbohydrate-binding domain-containing protein [Paracraurococcus lichenis]|uniref:Carbohydrate-binding domain-containing protein n=1 Tax=Paracraurococcus lichenis TaxID=3064888 RepID=A0ABT9E0S1_9PROT|nr:carbohydrate-binding domain-containing protein [Paracraurococcus sp. LOR1-02]MDO9709700.1 carbohydrate-binding domain-containing protein [Paracraurococcus sp. LOR1-02]
MDLSTPNTTGADTLVINLSQDAWQGDARFTVAIDGQQVGGESAAATAHGAGTDALTLHGDFAGGQHTLTVTFTNDAYGDAAGADRNLYVDGVALNGNAVDGSTKTLLGNGSVDIAFGAQGGDTSSAGTGGDTGGTAGGIPGNWQTVWDESFDNGPGMFSNQWGPGTDSSVPGQITVWTSADDQDSGMMTHPDGYGTPAGGWGYGLYSFTFKTEGTAGTYALTWPASNVWPGPELDVMEINDQGQPYSTIHWKGDDGSNQFQSFTMADVDPKQVHTYAMDWEQGRITLYVDGQQKWTTTEHVPNDHAHGGENTAPGIGTQTWWNGGAEGGHNFITLYDASYKVMG